MVWYVRKRIDHWCSMGTGKSHPLDARAPPFQRQPWETLFSTRGADPEVGVFLSALNTNDIFYFSVSNAQQ